MPAIVFELMHGRLGTAILRAKGRAGLDVDASPEDIDASPWFYEPGSLAITLTPSQVWHDDETLHRGPRYHWHVERERG
jgi:hypothetical protein